MNLSHSLVLAWLLEAANGESSPVCRVLSLESFRMESLLNYASHCPNLGDILFLDSLGVSMSPSSGSNRNWGVMSDRSSLAGS